MWAILTTIFLISLVLGQEEQKLNLKFEEKNDDDIILRGGSSSCGMFTMNLSFTITLPGIINALSATINIKLDQSTFKDSIINIVLERFIVSFHGELLISAYYHKNKRHSVTCNGRISCNGSIKSIASKEKCTLTFYKTGDSTKSVVYNYLE